MCQKMSTKFAVGGHPYARHPYARHPYARHPYARHPYARPLCRI
jgi:hypothetical protein